MTNTSGPTLVLTFVCAVTSTAWGQGVDIQTYNDSSTSTSRMQFQQGVASPASITVLNARLLFNGSSGYFNITSAAAASPSAGDLRYDGTNALLFTSSWRALAFTETGAAAFTSGSVLFAGSNGLLQQDNSSLFFNDSTNRLGIGDATPDVTLDIESSETALSAFTTTSTANAFTFTANSVNDEDVMTITATGLTMGRALAISATAAPTGGVDVQGIYVGLTSAAGDNNPNEASAIWGYVSDTSARPTDNIGVKGEVVDTGTPAANLKEVFGGWFRGSKTATAGYAFGTDSYGVRAEGVGDTDGANTIAFGIWAKASGADENFGGYFSSEDNGTSTVLEAVGLYRETTGTPANNIGTGLLFVVEGNAASGTEPEDVAQINGILTNATHGSEAGALAILTRTGGGALTERLRVAADGTVTPGASLQDLGTSSSRWDIFGATSDFNSSVTTGAAVQITASSLTSGEALSLAGPSGDITTFTGHVIYGSAALGGTGANLIYLDGTVEATSGTVDASWFRVSQTGNSGSNTLRSVFSQLTDSTSFANTNVGLLADVSKTGGTSSGTVNTYGVWADVDASTTADGATFNTYAVRADASGDVDGISTAYGLYASAGGADTNWAGYFSGNVSILGATAGSAALDVDRSDPSSNSELPTSVFRGMTQTISGPVANLRFNQFLKSTVTAGSAQTVTTAATVYIEDAPVEGANVTITDSFALMVSGPSSFDGALRVGGTDLTLSNGDNNNVDTQGMSRIRITGPTAAFTITGIVRGADGDILIIHNATGQNMTLANEHASSTAANRILTLAGSDQTTTAEGSAILIYSGTDSRWILLSFRF